MEDSRKGIEPSVLQKKVAKSLPVLMYAFDYSSIKMLQMQVPV